MVLKSIINPQHLGAERWKKKNKSMKESDLESKS